MSFPDEGMKGKGERFFAPTIPGENRVTRR